MGAVSDDESEYCSDKQRSRKQWIEHQNIKIRNCLDKNEQQEDKGCSTEGRELSPDSGAGGLGGSCRNLLRVPCALSLSTLTGISAASRVVRPCQAIKTASLGQCTARTSASSLLLHGYDWVSAEDQRILAMMVARREAQLEQQEVLISARQLWEKDRILYNQMVNEKRKQWNELVRERRKIDKMEQERRKEAVEMSFSQHIADLERTINERHKRCEMRHKQFVLQKRQPHRDTDADLEFHRLRRQQQLEQEEARCAEHLQQIRQKESKADHNLAVITGCRHRAISIQRRERELRMVAARQMREALDEQLEEWCQQNKEQLQNRMCMSECRHDNIMQWRRKLAHDTNLVKSINHANAMSLLNEEEQQKELQQRQELFKKEVRIRNVKMRRENNIVQSRQHALTTSALRQQIKAAYPIIS